jgi:hypothetical protein
MYDGNEKAITFNVPFKVFDIYTEIIFEQAQDS